MFGFILSTDVLNRLVVYHAYLTDTVDFVINVHVQLGFDISRSEVVL